MELKVERNGNEGPLQVQVEGLPEGVSAKAAQIEVLRSSGEVATVGLSFVLALVIGTLGGWWLDRKLGTAPVITIIGFVGGVGAAVKALIRVTRDYQKKLNEEDRLEATENKKSPAPNQDPDDLNAN